VFETYLAMATQPVRDARPVYEQGLDDVHGPEHRDRLYADIQADADRLGRAFDTAIGSTTTPSSRLPSIARRLG
jgi:hypothetical protein